MSVGERILDLDHSYNFISLFWHRKQLFTHPILFLEALINQHFRVRFSK